MNNSLVLQRIGAVSGAAAAVLLFAGSIVGNINTLVSISTYSSTIAAAFMEHRSKIIAGAYLQMLGVFCLIAFVSYLRTYLKQSSSGTNWLPSMALAGGITAGAMLLLSAHVSQAFTVPPNYGAETQIAKALYALEWNDLLLVEAPALAAMIAATAITGFLYKLFPWWFNWWGALLALLLLIPAISWFCVIIAFIWILALSILLLVKTRAAASG